MAVSCEAKCGKSILLSFTLLHCLAGAALLLLGGSILLDPAKLYLFHFVTFGTLEREYGLYVAYGLLTAGGAILLISSAGCCGAIKENRGLLGLYFGFLLMLMVLEIGTSTLTLYFRGAWMKNMEGRLRDTLLEHYGNHSTHDKYLTFTDAMDFAQHKFGCCGIIDHRDYQFSKWRYKSRGFPEDKDSHLDNPKYLNLVPLTCCLLKSTSEPWIGSASSPMSTLQRESQHGTVEESWQTPNAVNQSRCQLPKTDDDYMLRHLRGCHQMIEEWFQQESTILITLGFATSFLQLLGLILTTCLCCNLRVDIRQERKNAENRENNFE